MSEWCLCFGAWVASAVACRMPVQGACVKVVMVFVFGAWLPGCCRVMLQGADERCCCESGVVAWSLVAGAAAGCRFKQGAVCALECCPQVSLAIGVSSAPRA